jgi:hypothetical protein
MPDIAGQATVRRLEGKHPAPAILMRPATTQGTSEAGEFFEQRHHVPIMFMPTLVLGQPQQAAVGDF